MTAKTYFLLLFMWLGIIASLRATDPIYFKVRINMGFPENQSIGLGIADVNKGYDDYGVLILPDCYSSTGKPTRLVYCAHGAGGGVDSTSWFLKYFSVIDTLLANGYAVFDVNGGPSLENMGGSWVVQSAFKAYGFIKEHYNIHDEIFVVGFSMGGLSSSNFIYRHPRIVIAHGMMSPVLGLKDQAWDNPWYPSTRQSIATSYDFNDQTGRDWEQNKVVGWDPLYTNTFKAGNDTLKIYPVPVKIWHGERDQLVKVESSLRFHQYIRNAQGYAELRLLDSDDHGLSVGNPSINHELILFFKRFDF